MADGMDSPLSDLITGRSPIFEIHQAGNDTPILIYANGNVTGAGDAVVVNKIKPTLDALTAPRDTAP